MTSVNSVPFITVDSLVEKTCTVYSLPLFYERLNEIINHPRCSIDDIAKVITEDQGLTARLLRLANSPMFGCFSKIDSISKAVTIIGTQQLRDLALAMSVLEIFSGIPEELISMKSFWKHSIACGIIARSLAAYRRESNVERYFAAGILHDVGQLVMCTAIPDVVHELLLGCRRENSLFTDMEIGYMGFTHAEVGGELLLKWKIPATIAEPVSLHHNPANAERYPVGVAIIHLADIICHALEMGSSCERFVHNLDGNGWKRVDIPPGAVSRIVRYVEPQVEETFAILGEFSS